MPCMEIETYTQSNGTIVCMYYLRVGGIPMAFPRTYTLDNVRQAAAAHREMEGAGVPIVILRRDRTDWAEVVD
jgi:hypothetical protein